MEKLGTLGSECTFGIKLKDDEEFKNKTAHNLIGCKAGGKLQREGMASCWKNFKLRLRVFITLSRTKARKQVLGEWELELVTGLGVLVSIL